MEDAGHSSAIVGFQLPTDFNVLAYDAVSQHVSSRASGYVVWRDFGLAWNGTAYRYRAAAESDEEFTSSIAASNSPPFEERYQQERALYSFFSNGLSAVECWFFAMYCLGAIIDPAAFPVSKPGHLNVTPTKVRELFTTAFPGERVSQEMGQCLDSPEFQEFAGWRNVLSHRGVPPRHFHRGGPLDGQARMPANPKALSGLWEFRFELDTSTTTSRRGWLSAVLNDLITAAESFAKTRL